MRHFRLSLAPSCRKASLSLVLPVLGHSTMTAAIFVAMAILLTSESASASASASAAFVPTSSLSSSSSSSSLSLSRPLLLFSSSHYFSSTSVPFGPFDPVDVCRGGHVLAPFTRIAVATSLSSSSSSSSSSEEEQDEDEDEDKDEEEKALEVSSSLSLSSTVIDGNGGGNGGDDGSIIESECVALLPGKATAVTVRIGPDAASGGRKAWKKRRRSGSPIYVPCELVGLGVGVGREWLVRNNVAYILHRYGEAMLSPTTNAIKEEEGNVDKMDEETMVALEMERLFANGYGDDGNKRKRDRYGAGGVALRMGKMCRLYERDLGGSLLDHSKALGYDKVGDMLLGLFNERRNDRSGVEIREHGAVSVITGLRSNLWLVSSHSRRKARDASRGACLARFSPCCRTDGDDKGKGDYPDGTNVEMIHVGTVKVRRPAVDVTETPPDTAGNNRPSQSMFAYVDVPLTAALRISQRDADSGRAFLSSSPSSSSLNGEVRNAYVQSYSDGGSDTGAAGGNPFLTLVIDPPRTYKRRMFREDGRTAAAEEKDAKDTKEGQMGRRGRRGRQQQQQQERLRIPPRDLSDLSVGDGPIRASVVAVSGRSGAAFVDCGVRRRNGKKKGGGVVDVLGMLRFDDVVRRSMKAVVKEEGELLDADGDNVDGDVDVMTVEDLFASVDDDEDWDEEKEDDDDEEEEDMFAGMSPEERLRAIADMMEEEESDESITDVPLSSSLDAATTSSPYSTELDFLAVGDEVDVYVQAVFPQSGRFMVTLDPSVRGKKAKDMKRQRLAEKRMSKLADRIGGWGEGLVQLLDLVGTECDGKVKARSKTGNWYYVQPILGGDDDGLLPVGVATLVDGAEEEEGEELKSGDRVRVRLEGIDEERGQLSMKLLP